MEAARLATKCLKIIAGAPNVVRGGSLANASALDYAEEGMLDILSSDYMPVSQFTRPLFCTRSSV